MMIRLLSLAAAITMISVAPAEPPALHVQGNQVLTASGKAVRLAGVNAACLEWSNDGEGHIMKTAQVAVEHWHANFIRLPLSQDRWFGAAEGQSDGGKAYRALVRQVVDYISSKNAYVLLDLHWNNAGEWGRNIGQHVMPDMNSVTFWRDCARAYRNEPAVLFDLYNEPHDTSWEIWMNGGEIEEKTGVGARQGAFKPVKYRTPGMQALLDTVRSTGAKNVVVVGGLDWAYDLSGFLKGFALRDPHGSGIIYACHSYPFKGDTVAKWLAKLDMALPHIPVIISEFGVDPGRNGDRTKPDPWAVEVMAAIQQRKCNYTAWDLHPAAGPTLISDWNYTPTPWFGTVVKSALAQK
jgi:hypothetical protein